MSYDIGGGYDGWKTATPWDDEVSITVSFECSSPDCEEYNEGVEAIAGKRDEYVDVECNECGKLNGVDIGGDW
jgi:hypothetical protein